MPIDPRDPQPTEPIRAREPVAREPVLAADPVADAAWFARIEDQVRSLRTMVALLSVLSLLALGLGAYALLRDDDSGRGASRERVARLDDRVRSLEARAGRSANSTDTNRLATDLADKADKADVDALKAEVKQLRTSVAQSGSGDSSATTAVNQLSTRVDRLAQQVDDLRANSTTTP